MNKIVKINKTKKDSNKVNKNLDIPRKTIITTKIIKQNLMHIFLLGGKNK